MRFNRLFVSTEQISEIRETARKSAQEHGDEICLTYGQHVGLAVAIQMANDSGTPVTMSWYVGLGGSCGKQVFGKRPPIPSSAALTFADMILRPVDDELENISRNWRKETDRKDRARRIRQMGIGRSRAHHR
jgi:hypothetical protein